ncbi:ABC transporter permease [Rhabdothermincola salaria]|uniref:ABC transporter permease n=1 Tax=Rhabdothermincola salaria TaxID=2903142 RepID=UPI001E5EEAA2|nr:FtsX-like permease family protein [Rhabdothermincola salaria]MCD9624806.1 FtsX-like permease family protein [Rhabdothermincola salaria]
MLRLTLRGLRAHKVRLVATAVSVLLGVAFMSGTQVLTGSVSASFDKVFADVYARIDTVVRSTTEIDTPFGAERAKIDESLLPAVQAVEGVEAAEGQVIGQIRVLDRTGEPLVSANGPPNFALNWLTSPALNGWTVEGAPPQGPDQVVLDAKTAADGDFAVGDRVDVSLQQGIRSFEVVGVARFGEVDTWGGVQAALFDTATVQDIVQEPGQFDWISVAGADGVGQQELTDRVAAVLPPETQAITGEEFTEESQSAFQQLISIFNTFLLTFALIALFVGSFIIYNTFSIIVAQRTRELALVRAIGASRGQVLRSVLLEALVVGFGASAVGVGLGILLAIGLNELLRSIGFAGPETPIIVPATAVVSSLLVGTGITLVSAIFPARKAATVPPVAAMRDVAVDTSSASRIRLLAGLAVVVLGSALLYAGLTAGLDDDLQVLGAGAAAVFVGFAVLGPVTAPPLSRFIGWPLPRLRGVTGRLARENAVRSPRRTASTASALMIGVGLVVFIAVIADSLKASTTDAIDASVRGQYVVTTEGFGPTALPVSVADDLRALPEVEVAAGFRAGFGTIDGDAQVVLAVDPADLVQVIDFTDVEGRLVDLEGNGVAISAGQADERGLTVGSTLPASFLLGGETTLEVQAVYETRFDLQGAGWLITQDLYESLFPPQQQTDQAVYVALEDPSSEGIAAARPDLEAVVDPVTGAEVQDLTEFKQTQTDQADQFLLIVYVLLALALIIAVVGVVNTLLLSVYERTRELGLLRAVGMSRRQVRASVRWESVIISLIGTFTGLGIGLVFGWALVRALADDGITVFTIPVGQLAIMVAIAALAGVGAALYPASRAARLDVLTAIATE